MVARVKETAVAGKPYSLFIDGICTTSSDSVGELMVEAIRIAEGKGLYLSNWRTLVTIHKRAVFTAQGNSI